MTTEPPFDAAALCDAFENDLEVIQELIALVARDLPRYQQTREAAADAGDLIGVGRASHAIKGAVGNVCAFPLCEITEGLEQAGRSQDLARVTELRPAFRAASAALLEALAAWPDRAPASEAAAVTTGVSR